MSLELVYYPHPALRHVSKPLKRVDAELRRMVARMFELMYEHEGVGLAANQVNLPYRLFVANADEDRDNKEAELVFINPVLRQGKGRDEAEEGCLSIPDVRAPVLRHETIEVQAFDLAGNEIRCRVNGLLSRVVQHETDHLDGVLFIDRLSPEHLAEVTPKIQQFEAAFQSQRESGEALSSTEIAKHLEALEKLRA